MAERRKVAAIVRAMPLKGLDMFSSADGTRVVSRWVVTGYNAGILGSSPDDRPIQFTGIAVWEVRDGKLAPNWWNGAPTNFLRCSRSRPTDPRMPSEGRSFSSVSNECLRGLRF
jgi:hypothetical protein